MSLLDERRLFGGLVLGLILAHALGKVLLFQRGALLFIMLVEEHVEIAYQVVALLVGRLGRNTVAPLQPGQHRLADVDTAIVDDIGLDHLVAIGLHDLGERPTEEIVAHVAQVERLVGIGRGIFNHDERTLVRGLLLAPLRVGVNLSEQVEIGRGGNDEVEESLYHVETAHLRAVVLQPVADFRCRVLRFLMGEFQKRKHHQGEIALKVRFCLLQLYHFLGYILTVELLHSRNHCALNC